MSTNNYVVTMGGESRDVVLTQEGGHWIFTIDGKTHKVEQIVVERDEIYSLIIEGHSYMVDLTEKDWTRGEFTVHALAGCEHVRVRDELEAIAEEMSGATAVEGLFELAAPMPGIVVRPLKAAGDKVEKGEGLIILEAMKMQNELASEIGGIVQEILVEDGQLVETGESLARVIREEE